MVSDMWLSVFGGIASTYGFDPSATVYLFALAFAVGVTVAVSTALKGEHNTGLPIFFFTLLLLTFIGAFDWLFLILPLVLIGAYYLKGVGT